MTITYWAAHSSNQAPGRVLGLLPPNPGAGMPATLIIDQSGPAEFVDLIYAGGVPRPGARYVGGWISDQGAIITAWAG